MSSDGGTGTAPIARRGFMLVLSSPSGAGKSSLAQHLLSDPDGHDHGFLLSVSVTTRDRRPSELEGKHYHFIKKEQFVAMRERGELLEWAEVHGNLYGTPREPVLRALEEGVDVLFDIDWQGTLQLYEKMREDIVSVFILPPSISELRARLQRRAEDSEETIHRRLANAREEIRHWPEYDYVIRNSDLTESFGWLKAIVQAERLRRFRQPGLESFVAGLERELDKFS